MLNTSENNTSTNSRELPYHLRIIFDGDWYNEIRNMAPRDIWEVYRWLQLLYG
jgi:hypothetical protein